MPLKRTYITFFITLISAIVAVLVFFFVFRIIKHKNEHTGAVLASIQSTIDQKDNISNLQKTVNDTKEKEKLLSSYLVQANFVNEFITFLETEGESVSVPVEILGVNALPDVKNLLTIEMKGVGTFEHVVRLVSLIQNAPYQIKLNHTYINKVIVSSAPAPVPVLVKGKPVPVINPSESLFEVNIEFNVVSTE